MLALAGMALLVSAGLAAPPVQLSFQPLDDPELAPAPPPLTAKVGLTLEDLLEQASRRHPALAVARARVELARGQLIQAGLYPNPILTWEADDIGHRQNAAGTQGPIITQLIVTAHKLRLARAAAAQGVAIAEWQAVTRWFEVVTRVRLAWYETLTAQEQVRTTEEIVRLSEEGLEAARKLQKAGAGTQTEILRAQVELEQSRLQLTVARERLAAARKLLAAAAGLPTLPETALVGNLHVAPPAFVWEVVLGEVKQRSSEIHEALTVILQAEAQLQKAQADAVPNVQVQLRPFYNFPNQQAQGRVEVGLAIPLFNRNQGNIHAAQAEVVRAHHDLYQVELRLTEQLAAAFQRYRSALEQREGYEKRILPGAAESLRLIRLGYERGDPKYDYTALLQAQRTLAQARLAAVQAAGDLWKASSEIAGILQVEPAGAHREK